MAEEEIDPDILAMLDDSKPKDDAMEVDEEDDSDDEDEDSDDSGSDEDEDDSEEEESSDSDEEEEDEEDEEDEDEEDNESDEDEEKDGAKPPAAKKQKLVPQPRPPPKNQKSPEDYVGKMGTRVRMLANNEHLYINGTMSKYIPPVEDDDAPFWWYEHEDGDGEELELDEVKEAIRLFKTRPKTKNARQLLSEQVKELGDEYTARFNDLVWGKGVTKEPWWPGIIVDPLRVAGAALDVWQRKQEKPNKGLVKTDYYLVMW